MLYKVLEICYNYRLYKDCFVMEPNENALTAKSAKFVSLGKYEYVSSKGKTVTCRKGMRGEYCKLHQGNSVNAKDLKNLRTLEEHIARSQEKLSPFENGCIWLYSILNRMPIEQAREHYTNSTGMYSFLGVKQPEESEVKGLQKALLKLIDASNNKTSQMGKLREMVKRMTLGQGFTVAGFHALKDMVKESLTKLKVAIAGLGLAGTLTLTGCAGAVPSPNSSTSQITEYEDNTGLDTDAGHQVEGTQATNLTIVPLGSVTDELGAYTRSGFKAPDVSVINNKGVPASDLASAFDFYTNFVSTEVMDSIALDNPKAWDKWKTEVAPKYISSSYLDQILSAGNDGQSADIIMTNRANLGTSDMYVPELARDGKPRVFNKQMTDISAQPVDGGVYITATVAQILAVGDKGAIGYMNISAGDGVGEQIATYNDNKIQAAKVISEVGLTLIKDGNSWNIAGFNNAYTINSGSLIDNATSDILALRK